jgi:hypothetical protein
VESQIETTAPTKLERVAFSIAEFCFRNDISLSTYHKLRHAGLGPQEMRFNTVVRISRDAESKWQKARTNPRGAEAAAVIAAQARGVERGRTAAKLAVRSPRHQSNIKRKRARGA